MSTAVPLAKRTSDLLRTTGAGMVGGALSYSATGTAPLNVGLVAGLAVGGSVLIVAGRSIDPNDLFFGGRTAAPTLVKGIINVLEYGERFGEQVLTFQNAVRDRFPSRPTEASPMELTTFDMEPAVTLPAAARIAQ